MSAKKKRQENKLNYLRNELDLWHHKVSAVLDDKKKIITPTEVSQVSNAILKYLWTRELIKSGDIATITKIEPATSPTRGCSQNQPTSPHATKRDTVTPIKAERGRSPRRQTPSSASTGNKTRSRQYIQHSVCDDVKCTLQYEEDFIQTTDYQKEYLKVKSENDVLRQELEKLERLYKYFEKEKTQLKFEVELLTREKSTLSLEAQNNYKKLEDKYRREITNAIDDNANVRAGRYRAERNLARLDIKDLHKEINDCKIRENELTRELECLKKCGLRENELNTDLEYLKNRLEESESDVKHKDKEIESLKNRIESLSQFIEEIQKSAEENSKDANNAIVHYKEEEQRCRKERDRANDKVSALKIEKYDLEERLSNINKDTKKQIHKITTEKDETLSMLQKQKRINKEERQRHKNREDNLSNEIQTLQIELENEKSKNSQRDREDIRREGRSNTKLCDENDELKKEILDMQKRLAEQSREHIEIEQRFKEDTQRYKQERNRAIKSLDTLKRRIDQLNEERKELEAIHVAEVEKFHKHIDSLKDKLSEHDTKGYSLEEHQKETLDKKNEEIVLLTRKRYELEEELKFSNERKSVIEMAYEEMKTKFQNMTQRLQESEHGSIFSGNKRLSDIEKENESLSTELTMSLKTIEKLKQDYKILEKKIEIERSKYKDTLTQMRAELSNRKSQDVDQREHYRILDEEKQNLTSKIYSLENENAELNERIKNAETNLMQMQMIREENDRLKRSLSDMRTEVKDIEAKYKGDEETITNLKDENDRLRKEGNFAKKETERVTREKDTLAKELQTEINIAKTEHDKLRREKNELIILFKEESKKDKDKINKLEQESQLLHTRYKQEADIVGIEGTNARLKIENERLRNERNSTRTDLQQKAKDNEVLKRENQALNDEYEQLKKKKVELVSIFQVESEKHKHHTEKLEREMEVLRERCSSGEKAKQYNSYELLQLKNDFEICKKQKAQAEENVTDLQQEIRDLENSLKDLESKYQHCMKCYEYERKLNRLKKDYHELQDRNNIASTDFHLANKKLEELRNEVENGKMETARVTEVLEKAIKEKSNLERQLGEMESKYQHCMKCHEYERKLNKHKQDYQELQDRYNIASTDIHQTNKKLEELSNQVENGKMETARVTEVLEIAIKEKSNLEQQLREFESTQKMNSGEVISLQRRINTLQSENAELNQRCQQKDKVQQEADNNKRKLHGRISQLESNITELKQDKETLNSRIEVLREEKSDLEERIREFESTRKMNSGEVISLQRQINTLQSENADLNQRCQQKDKVQQEADNNKRKLHGRISQLESSITELKQDKETLNSRIEVLREEKSDLEERIRRRSPQVLSDPRNCQNCWKYRNDISDLKREVNDLRDRLSEAAGNKLRDNNPNIADLSDMNRPTSLAEKFGSLYTDEYTDAMEVIEDDMDEKAVVDVMLQWLRTCYDWCEKLAKEQRDTLTTKSIGFMQTYVGHRMDLTLPDRCNIFIKEFQKKIAADCLSPVGKICNEKSVKEDRISSDNRIIKYLKKCSDLCWMMQIADPPMHLNFEIQQGQNLDKNYYNVFTKSGSTIDFLVWPVLKLHRNGPMLAKGVAQGK